MRSPHCKSVPAQSQIWHTMWQCCLKWRTICKSHVKHILLYMCLICLTVFWTHGVPNTPQVKPTEDNCEAYFTQNVSNVTLVPDLQCGVPCKYILTILGLVSICTVKKIVPWGNIQFALMLYRMKLKATILYIYKVRYIQYKTVSEAGTPPVLATASLRKWALPHLVNGLAYLVSLCWNSQS
jgi:hypothetical protein